MAALCPEISEEILRKWNGHHTWYLAEENMMLCLCSKSVKLLHTHKLLHNLGFSRLLSDDEKARLAARLVSFPRMQPLSLDKPKLPVICDDTLLADLVGSRSWLIFNILGLKGDFLFKCPSQWDEDEEFARLRRYVTSLKVKIRKPELYEQ